MAYHKMRQCTAETGANSNMLSDMAFYGI